MKCPITNIYYLLVSTKNTKLRRQEIKQCVSPQPTVHFYSFYPLFNRADESADSVKELLASPFTLKQFLLLPHQAVQQTIGKKNKSFTSIELISPVAPLQRQRSISPPKTLLTIAKTLLWYINHFASPHLQQIPSGSPLIVVPFCFCLTTFTLSKFKLPPSKLKKFNYGKKLLHISSRYRTVQFFYFCCINGASF